MNRTRRYYPVRGHRRHLLRDLTAGTCSAVAIVLIIVFGYVVMPTVDAWMAGPNGLLGSHSPSGPVGAPAVTLDDQMAVALTGDSTNLTYTVSAVAQSDANGYGPAYLVNGVTPAGYWYQVGIVYNWVSGSLSGYYPGFYFLAQVWSPFGVNLVNQPAALNIQSGDPVQVSLVISGGTVFMNVSDDQTGSSNSYPANSYGSNSFVGTPFLGDFLPAFSGVMTEWYHVGNFTGAEQAVNYTASQPYAGSVIMVIDEGNVSDGNHTEFFQSSPVADAACLCVVPLEYHGMVVDVVGSRFVTGFGV